LFAAVISQIPRPTTRVLAGNKQAEGVIRDRNAEGHSARRASLKITRCKPGFNVRLFHEPVELLKATRIFLRLAKQGPQ
jgi:hypothetical protein